MFEKKTLEITDRLEDNRSKKVVFTAHCILNSNVRVQAAGFRKGPVNEIVDELQNRDYGIVQMKCPEQKAWGGILRKLLWQPVGIKGTPQAKIMPVIYPLFIWNTRRVWKGIAKETVSEMVDYVNSGHEIVGIIGIAASPSCGIYKTLDIKSAFEWVSGISVDDIEASNMRKMYLEKLTIPGKGMYIDELQKEMRRKNISAQFYEHNPFEESNDEPLGLIFKGQGA